MNATDTQRVGTSEVACAALAVLALVGTWGHNISYLPWGFLGANEQFWRETLANPASRSITVDLLVLALPVACWMFSEARRLGMGGIWFYLAASILVAISVALPIFIIHRGRTQRRYGEASPLVLGGSDRVAIGVLMGVTLAYVVLSFASR